jgi:hypothetical protein
VKMKEAAAPHYQICVTLASCREAVVLSRFSTETCVLSVERMTALHLIPLWDRIALQPLIKRRGCKGHKSVRGYLAMLVGI